ncbi:universal stress protein [Limnohabitans sp. 103DPR2]|uniref:universal stress protein n=1 Tax=Limnohabitans sp. 103DPR2 TaxID=1678129 RepID=UPI0006DCFFEE|nr:universal stress protein [Limnohabitans sp. 103DPR2]ALK92044.1 Stress response protein NhaX [Limnohabitans sp. 103DPR2]
MKILVATDGSKASEGAVKYAARLFKSFSANSHITVITVQDDSSLRFFKKHTPKGAVEDYLREVADKNLAWAVKYLNKIKLPHDMAIRYGHPSEQIINEAKAGKFDMIVMGTKGRSSWSDTAIGSVAQRVVGTSKTPVLLVKD